MRREIKRVGVIAGEGVAADKEKERERQREKVVDGVAAGKVQ